MLDIIQGIDFIFSGACNMKCTYCYIDKHPEFMHAFNEKARKAILDHSYVKKVKETIADKCDQINNINLWGAEPTMNLDLCKIFFDDCFEAFPNTRMVFYSTNALLGLSRIGLSIDAIKEIADKIKDQITLTIQFSIDGPDWITDQSRHKGACANSVKVIGEVIDYIQSKGYDKYLFVNLTTKQTVSCDWMKYMVDNRDKMQEWFKFFDDLTIAANDKILPEFKDRINIEGLGGLPTIVNPGEHTKEDGLIFASFIRALRQVDCSNFKFINHPLYGNVYFHLNTVYRGNYYTLNFWPWVINYGCSAGYTTWSFDPDGNLISCHRVADELFMSGQQNSEYIKWSSTIGTSGEEKDDRIHILEYVEKSYSYEQQAQFTFLRQLVVGLVYTGYLDPKYLNNHLLRWVHACYQSLVCYLGNYEMTGSRYTPALTYINLLCFGAAEELYNYYTDMWTEELVRK